jgi:hypothetical protein
MYLLQLCFHLFLFNVYIYLLVFARYKVFTIGKHANKGIEFIVVAIVIV